jgi:hypothetical protein
MFKSFKNVSTLQARIRRHREKVQAVVELKARVFMYTAHSDGSILIREGADSLTLPPEVLPEFRVIAEKVVSYLIDCGFTPEMVTDMVVHSPDGVMGCVIVSDLNSDKKKRLTDWKESYNG